MAVLEQRENQIEALKERGARGFDEKPVLTTQSVKTIEDAFGIFQELHKDNGRYREDFRVAMLKENVKRRRDGNHGPFRSYQDLTLHIWCLNPAVAFEVKVIKN